MNYKLLLIGIFAIVTSYLVFSIPVTSATNVKIYYNGVYQSSVQYNPQTFVSRTVSVESGNVKINVTNGTSSTSIQKVYVYKCRGLAPTACASTTTPDISESSFGGSYPWSMVADRTTGYPQRANFLILAKITVSGKVFWTGFWHWIERTDSSTYTPYESQIGEIQIHAKDIDDVATIGNFITSNRMVPFNPQWVTRVVFPAASALYLIKSTLSGIESQQFTPAEIQQNQITSLDQDYGFAFGNMTTQIFSPVALNLNPNYICGNSNCESGLGESQANCCTDCPCQAGYYCDAGTSCKQSSGISLALYGTPQTTVSNCNQQHVLNITVKVNNPPTGMTLSAGKYKLGSNPYQGTSCAAAPGSIFTCPVTVPAVPNCQAGTYRVGPNYINLTITYPDGKNTATKVLAVPFPDVTIGSYACGNGACESSLGESPGVCCYDCGCPSGYCDSQNPQTGSCKTDPSNGNLIASVVTPSQFYTHTPGDSVKFFGQVTNSPVTLTVTDDSCSIKCSRSDSQACSATCDVSCSNVVSSDPSVYNSSCSMSFTVAGYDPLKSYSLYPVLNFSVRYTNGSYNTIQKVLSNSFTTITIGAHWCGDKKCDPDETSATCCYDCPCAEGQYCDTQNLAYNSQGDSCKSNPQVVIDSTSSADFTDSYLEHVINVTGRISGRPGGIEISPACVFSSSLGGVPCYASCQEITGSSSAYNFLCQITVPPIDYNTSSFYDPETRKITIGPNSLNLSLSYNNGPSKKIDQFSSSIPQVEINVVPKCGNGVCERSIDEASRNCCIDCECSQDFGRGYFCYTGKSPKGECLSVSLINMRIREVQPNPVNCIILQIGKQCTFTSSMKVYPVILNPPSDLEIIDAYYSVNSGGVYTNSTSLNCYKTGEGIGNYSCAFILEKSNQTTPGNENRTIELKMSLAYTINGALAVKNVSDTSTFTIKRAYSEAVASCIQQQASLDKKIKKLKSDKTLYTVLAVIFFLISLIFWILFIISCFSSTGCTLKLGTIATIAAIIGGCGLGYVLSKLESIDGKIKQLQAEKQAICAAEGFGALSSATSSGTNWVYTIGKLYGSVTCAVGVSGAVGGLSSGGASATGTGTGAGSGGFSILETTAANEYSLGMAGFDAVPVAPVSTPAATGGAYGGVSGP
ncbi:MAG: hypothetical protein NTY20_00945 [Candidatus Aenigmarchaeota archaeon]|nr:hypothetical protein [Candidatus Aenigmarchaeota archaeon]